MLVVRVLVFALALAPALPWGGSAHAQGIGGATGAHAAPVLGAQLAPPTATDLRQLEARIANIRESVLDSTVGLRFRTGHATGVLVTEAGHILTVGHAMAEPGRRVTVVLRDGRELEGRCLGRNEHGDFGLVKIVDEEEAWTWSEMAPEATLRSEQPCLGTGYPGWIAKSRGPILRFGIISGWTASWIRSTCVIMPGDSGGPLFNLDGRVIGISSWIERPTDANYAVPVARYRDAWDRLVEGEVWENDPQPERNRSDVPRTPQALRLGMVLLDVQRAAEIAAVLPNSPAFAAGVQAGDRVRGVGSVRFDTWQRLETALVQAREQTTFTLHVLRGTDELELELATEVQADFPAEGHRSLRAIAEALAAPIRPAIVQIQSQFERTRRNIAGVVVDERGAILTKASELGDDIRVSVPGASAQSATVVATDEETDLALLRIEGTGYSTLRFEPEHEFVQGQWMASIAPTAGRSSHGVVSARPERSRGSRRAYLGVRMENSPDGGALIQTVEPGTAAERAGLRNLDVIRRYNEIDIGTYFDLQTELRRAWPGQDVALMIRRADEELELRATLGRRPQREQDSEDRHVADTVALSERRYSFPLVVRHDANVAPSQCGSPVLDSNGRVIALNIARVDRTATLALPASEVLRSLEDLLATFESELHPLPKEE